MEAHDIAMLSVLGGLIAVIIGLLGFGGGKLWGTKKIEAIKEELKKLIVEGDDEMKEIHRTCHEACKAARIEKEEGIEAELRDRVRPRLVFGNLLMIELCEASGISKERVEELRKAVMNDQRD